MARSERDGEIEEPCGQGHNHNIHGKPRNISRTTLTEDIVKVLSWFDLKMEKPKASDKNHWWGTFMPYLTYCCCWQLRMKELRLGQGTMVLKKEGETEVVAKVKDFGLKSRHYILLEGITFPPEVRATIAQSVGPITTFIAVSKETKDSRYGKKHRDAAARAYAHVPGIETIIKTLEGTKAKEAAPLIGAMADLTLLVPARNQRRAYFPISWFAHGALTDEEWKYYTVKYDPTDPKLTTKVPTQAFAPVGAAMEVTTNAILSDLVCWDMSGKGAALIYNSAVKSQVKWSMPHTKDFDAEMMGQACFHAIWGSYCEDLSLIEWMTETRNWRKRRDMGNMFIGMGKAETSAELKLHPLLYYSKLVSANITNMMTETNDQVSSNPVWSGR